MKPLVVGLGEVLWDVFPDARLLGGAPANVAYHASVLGNEGLVASRVGNDELGEALVAELRVKGLNPEYVQQDPTHATGTVQVTFANGDPRYEIVRDVAWDFLASTPDWDRLASACSAACFSTLAQRSETSRETIEGFLAGMGPDALRVLDVNLRPPFVSETVLKSSIDRANVVKYNHQEGLFLKRLFWKDDLEAWLTDELGIRVVCVTKGADGCQLFTSDKRVSIASSSVDTSQGDPVGAGDGFSAALIDGLLKGLPLDLVARRANQYAGHVASKKGAMPDMSGIELPNA